MQMIRLQGGQFYNRLPVLRLVAYHVSTAGNICGYYRYLDEKYPRIYHWMNDVEQKKFLTNPPNVPKVPDHETASKIKVEVTHMKDYKKLRQQIVEEIRAWFDKNGPTANAVIGISGGKDSTVCAALLTEALGKDRVVGVLMPNGVQSDIIDSIRVVEALGIKHYTFNIGSIYDEAIKVLDQYEFTIQPDTEINLPPRLRMSVLYAVAQSLPGGGRVINTCNKSEDFVGYSSKYGDAAGDVSLLGNLFVSEIIGIGDTYEELPTDLVHKTPSDGLCGKSDEDRFGFTYDDIEAYVTNGTSGNADTDARIEAMHRASRHKYEPMYTCASDMIM